MFGEMFGYHCTELYMLILGIGSGKVLTCNPHYTMGIPWMISLFGLYYPTYIYIYIYTYIYINIYIVYPYVYIYIYIWIYNINVYVYVCITYKWLIHWESLAIQLASSEHSFNDHSNWYHNCRVSQPTINQQKGLLCYLHCCGYRVLPLYCGRLASFESRSYLLRVELWNCIERWGDTLYIVYIYRDRLDYID